MPETTASFGRFSSTAALTQHLLIALLPSMLVAVILIVTLALDESPSTRAIEQNFIDGKLTVQTHQFEHLDKFIWSEEHQRWLLAANDHQLSSDAEVLIRNSQDKEGRRKCVWPEDNCAGQDDRIIDQLRLQVPDGQRVIRIFPPHAMVRSFSLESAQADEQQEEELIDDCRRSDVARQCRIAYNLDRANVVIFPNADVIRQPKSRRADQIWVAYLLESPPNTFPERYQRHHRGRHEFNWTASYRSDSDIVAPYAKFVPYYHYHQQQQQQSLSSSPGLQHRVEHDDNIVENPTHRELIRGKRKKVAWFASNCHTANKRREFVKELSKFIQVDVYGKCGSFTCDKWNQTGCLGMLNNDYKFYLAFENSNSPEYITEKLFQNALGGNNPNHLLLPIVMGPSRNDYERLAPPNSFIHVNDFSGSAERLADYLKLLDSNDSLYYSYFSWKTMGRFVDTKFMCRVCLLAHETFESGKTKIYTDLKGWYTGKRSI